MMITKAGDSGFPERDHSTMALKMKPTSRHATMTPHASMIADSSWKSTFSHAPEKEADLRSPWFFLLLLVIFLYD